MNYDTLPIGLPAPDPDAADHSQKLLATLVAEIQANGPMTFARYMQQTLYAPGLGYYSAGSRKLGPEGDFITAPELSSLFSRCIARQCHQVLQELGTGDILEFGAGSGVMAADILLELEILDCLPTHYYILEISADLQARQQALLQERCPHLYSRIHWLQAMPEFGFNGIVLANEVLDAMPVQRFVIENNVTQELHVTWQQEALTWHTDAPSAALHEAVAKLRLPQLADVAYYESEINLLLFPWLQSLAERIAKGAILIIDYGFPRHEYYHPDRSTGTLMCHYRHRAHPDPLILPGLQDMTAHVDFTAIAECADACLLRVAGYTTQAAFLLACGITEMMGNGDGYLENATPQQLQLSQQIKKLTLPNEMGELFKVIALTREIDIPLLGFSFLDLRDRL